MEKYFNHMETKNEQNTCEWLRWYTSWSQGPKISANEHFFPKNSQMNQIDKQVNL